MNQPPALECEIHFDRQRQRKVIAPGPPPVSPDQSGRVPRVARLMALAIRCDELIRANEIDNYAQLARIGHVTRARISQIMSLLYLAPDLQEAVLLLPRTTMGRDPIGLRHLLPIAAVPDWRKQRPRWRELLTECQLSASAS